jgi:hypothetical protein
LGPARALQLGQGFLLLIAFGAIRILHIPDVTQLVYWVCTSWIVVSDALLARLKGGHRLRLAELRLSGIGTIEEGMRALL